MLILRTITIMLCCLAAVLGMPAQGSAAPGDSISVRSFDKSRITDYKAMPEFQYERELVKEPGAWERFKEWLARLLQAVLGETLAVLLSRNVVLVICLVLLILAAIVLGRGGMRRILVGEPASMGTVLSGTEDIRELDLEALLQEAERSGDLRRAIRLHYLRVLRLLVDKGTLRWSPDNTDHDYALQIEDAPTRARFLHVASVFQWVWYGDSPLTTERYSQLRTPFLEFEHMSVP